MSKQSESRRIELLGIDLAKQIFQLHGLDRRGKVVDTKKLSRAKLKAYLANLPPCRVAMEACSSAHYWARVFESYGHTVSLIAPQFVKPYVKSNKNDAVDAEAICEAAQRPNMRYVAIKSVEQQDVQALHRMRQLAVEQRTAQVNQIRGLLLEYGIDIPLGRVNVRRHLPRILEDAENQLTMRFREALAVLYEELIHLDDRIGRYDKQLQQIAQSDENARRLLTIPGIGPMIATALLSAVADVNAFRNGRQLAAWLGLVPRQHSTGGKEKLLGISKRGDVYLRMLVIHGARSVIRTIDRRTDRIGCWASRVVERRGKNIAAVAMANKMVRMAYALLRNCESYRQLDAPSAA